MSISAMKVGTYTALGGFLLLVVGGIIAWRLCQDPHYARSDQVLRDSVNRVAPALTETSITEASAPLPMRQAYVPVKVQTSAPMRSVHSPEKLVKRRPATAQSDREAIPGEWILRFKNRGDMEAFLGTAASRKAHIMDIIPGLNAVRVGAESRDDLLALVGDGDALLESVPNYYSHLPRAPSAQQPQTEPPGGYKGFGVEAMSWLGVNGDRSKWGQGVKVAVLDSGVGQCPAINEEKIARLDLLKA
ncbi:MAG: hypothetical protein WCP86_03365, partial [bacterium]